MVAAVRGGDEAAFSALAERYRPQLLVHCYRMLGSLEEAEDLVQETLLRAWRPSSGRTWGRRRPTCPGSSPTRTDCWMRSRRAIRSPTRW